MKILKKIAAILIVAVTMVSFISCNKDDKELRWLELDELIN